MVYGSPCLAAALRPCAWLACLALTAPALGQTVTMPSSVPVAQGRLAAVRVDYDGDSFDYVVPPELDAIREYTTDPKEVRLRVIGYQAGTFRIVAVSAKTVDGKARLSPFASCVVIVGPGPTPPPSPTPTPVPPPGPGPAPPPDPTPGPTPAGARALVIIRETAQSNPRLAGLLTLLQTGPPAGYLKSQGHSLAILDDDAVGPDGKPSPLVEAWRSLLADIKLPALVIYDPKTRNVLTKEPLPATAEEVLTILKRHGG